MGLTSLFNLKGLGIAFALGLLVGGGGAYFAAVSQFERAALSAAPKAAEAQHSHDVQQHGEAMSESNKAAGKDASSQQNIKKQVLVIYRTRTALQSIPANCPSNPEVSADVLDAYNKAGH